MLIWGRWIILRVSVNAFSINLLKRKDISDSPHFRMLIMEISLLISEDLLLPARDFVVFPNQSLPPTSISTLLFAGGTGQFYHFTLKMWSIKLTLNYHLDQCYLVGYMEAFTGLSSVLLRWKNVRKNKHF